MYRKYACVYINNKEYVSPQIISPLGIFGRPKSRPGGDTIREVVVLAEKIHNFCKI